MRYDNPELRQILAGEYVLGTLQGAARRRFERLLQADLDLQQLVESWEQRLNPLAESLLPVEPPPRVWQSVQRRIAPVQLERVTLWQRVHFWRGFALVSSALAVGLFLYLLLTPRPALVPTYIAVLHDTQARPIWLISAPASFHQLTIKVLESQSLQRDQAFELWVLPRGGQAPHSLGLLPPTGSITLAVPSPVEQLLPDALGLAVSLEPAGGSPTGLPTGPVLYQGVWLSL